MKKKNVNTYALSARFRKTVWKSFPSERHSILAYSEGSLIQIFPAPFPQWSRSLGRFSRPRDNLTRVERCGRCTEDQRPASPHPQHRAVCSRSRGSRSFFFLSASRGLSENDNDIGSRKVSQVAGSSLLLFCFPFHSLLLRVGDFTSGLGFLAWELRRLGGYLNPATCATSPRDNEKNYSGEKQGTH